MNFDIHVMIDTIWIVFKAVPRTFLLAAVILILGIILGAVLAQVKLRRIPIISTLVNIFVSYARGVPLIVHIYVMMNLLPDLGVSLLSVFGVTMKPHEFPSIIIVIVTYALLEAAVESENIRGAFQSIDPHQIEAGKSIGMTNRQNMIRIIIPQALSVAIPLFLNAFLKNIKGLSLAFTVGVIDILAQARFAAALSYRYLESYIAAALVYWLICGVLQTIFNRVEDKLKFGAVR
ncbi:ABC transporter permease subunit [Aerococcaceae bacterium DSM 109653]|uniref:ABC transporter permease subunit n=1 Tax=Fundicoccus ignavus TaxID=2664442 RepID=A0A6I2GHC1_9LACT|nr:amino acid ABC transporter permease [Fundicoccus ignavus]MRI81023.1 ABC transporter permease subunit [Fundicoccus ignavus]MRI86094.1 ABC transporter permease subunit [Fundicoccus ignavus]